MNVTVLSVASPSWKELTDITFKAMQDYCGKHGYLWKGIVGADASPIFYGWTKMEALQSALSTGIDDAVLCLDADCLITNPEVTVESFLTAHNRSDLFFTKDVNGFNAGSMIFRRSYATDQFLTWLLTLQDRFADNQNAIDYLSGHFESFIQWVPQKVLNAYLYHLYPGFAKPIGDWNADSFVLHLPGLPLQQRIEICRSIVT